MKKLLVLFAILAVTGTVSLAKIYENQECGFSIWFPDDWEISTEDAVLSADAPDGNAFVTLNVIENAGDLETALKMYVTALDDYFQNFKADGEPTQYELNGFVIDSISGSGVIDGATWDLDVNLIYTGKMVVLCISAVSEDAGDAYDATFEKIVGSLNKI
jgi:predicted Zn-dependent protease